MSGGGGVVAIKPDAPAVAIGQTWEEVDPRHRRRVLVVYFTESAGVGPTFTEGVVGIESINRKGSSRLTRAKISRFNGKRGGYRFISNKDERR